MAMLAELPFEMAVLIQRLIETRETREDATVSNMDRIVVHLTAALKKMKPSYLNIVINILRRAGQGTNRHAVSFDR